MSASAIELVSRYHDDTKHHVGRFARSLGYLDWASQPRPFRSFHGTPVGSLYPRPDATSSSREFPQVTYDRLFGESASTATPITAAAVGDVLRHSLALSAWKVFQGSRWSLRVNPSSGNLHPTEAYLVMGALSDGTDEPGVWHYAADRHVIERRCAFAPEGWRQAGLGDPNHSFLVVLTSIHWRESWKYGERAFRYCQHDLGHAIAALSLAAKLHGWKLAILPERVHGAIAGLVGLDRDEDYVEAEREEPGCLLVVTAGSAQARQGAEGFRTRGSGPDSELLDAVRQGRWFGKASQLSEDHVEWTFIDEVAAATRQQEGRVPDSTVLTSRLLGSTVPGSRVLDPLERGIDARSIVLQRRSAVALDGVSSVDRARFIQMLARTLPGLGAPWDAMWWSPRIHLALFVHRVTGVAPGLYVLARGSAVVPRLKAFCAREFRWERADDQLPLWLLQPGDFRTRSKRLSCDQDIAADGFFSLGMVADFEASLAEHGASFYRHLFWESGVVGQVLYLEAEAAGARATGIGCFFDDVVHELLGLDGHAFQSLYHFTVGIPVEDTRLTTEPGYAWQ
jgi:SagB-type dehydrogenase family enzyme